MNYIGSKYSLLEFIESSIIEVVGDENLKNYIFGDLFAGTGVVGGKFRSIGCKVISNDIQYYSYVLNKHYIQSSKNDVDEICLEQLNNTDLEEGFIYKNYCSGSGSGRNYFTDENGKKCDAVRKKIEELYVNKKISEKEYFSYLAGLINSIDKVANTASVYGAFLKKIKKSANKEFKLELLNMIEGPVGEVYNEDINVLVRKISGDILYLDPPYNHRQYSSNYHLLETIARYDNPEIICKTGLRNTDDGKSKYCSKKYVLENFEDLIKNAKFKYIFLSYNNEGLMSIEDVELIMNKYGAYKLFQKQYKRFKSDTEENRNILSDETIEYLHCLIKERE